MEDASSSDWSNLQDIPLGDVRAESPKTAVTSSTERRIVLKPVGPSVYALLADPETLKPSPLPLPCGHGLVLQFADPGVRHVTLVLEI